MPRPLRPLSVGILLGASFVCAPASAQVAVPLPESELPDIDLEACVAPQTVEEWRARGTLAGTSVRPLLVGESYCSVLRRRGVFVSLIKLLDERPDAPFEMGLCYPALDDPAEKDCAIFRMDDGEFRIHRIARGPR